MEQIDHMGKSALNALSKNNLTDAGRKKLAREIISGMICLSCLAVGLLYTHVLKGPYAIVPQLLYFVGFLLEGIPVILTGIRGVFTKNLTNAMEILVGIAILACVFQQQLILALLIPLILNSVHILEERSIMGGRDVIEGLKNMQQDTAVLLEGDTEATVDARTLKIGQKILIRPGSGIPIDGVVLSGESHIDEKSLTGEPEPSHVRAGSKVFAGTVNLDGTLTVEIRKEYVDTSFSRILALLEQSENISIPEARIVDRFLSYYIPFVLAVAAAVALATHDPGRAIAILVVSCPCGQMLASPAPMIAALSSATRHGILIKNSKFLESLTEIGTVVFDKTGTVTNGILSPTRLIPAEGISPDTLLQWAKTAATDSGHPVSRAVTGFRPEILPTACAEVREVSGSGMEGRTAAGQLLRFGKAEWLQSCGIAVPAKFLPEEGGSISCVALDGVLLGSILFDDTLREEAPPCIRSLAELGVHHTVMLTGDRKEPAEAIGAQAGIETVYARLLPQDKLDCLKKLDTADGRILAVGDGINDALILREADVGIAMGAMGSDLAIDSADIALMNNNLRNIPFVIDLAVRTRQVIYQNLCLSVSTSLIMILLSGFGLITALAGSLLHNLGAFAVLLNSSRILRVRQEADTAPIEE